MGGGLPLFPKQGDVAGTQVQRDWVAHPDMRRPAFVSLPNHDPLTAVEHDVEQDTLALEDDVCGACTANAPELLSARQPGAITMPPALALIGGSRTIRRGPTAYAALLMLLCRRAALSKANWTTCSPKSSNCMRRDPSRHSPCGLKGLLTDSDPRQVAWASRGVHALSSVGR
jgi:hypothetical protein